MTSSAARPRAVRAARRRPRARRGHHRRLAAPLARRRRPRGGWRPPASPPPSCRRSMPVGAVGLSPHPMRWLWPMSALVVLAPVRRRRAPRRGEPWPSPSPAPSRRCRCRAHPADVPCRSGRPGPFDRHVDRRSSSTDRWLRPRRAVLFDRRTLRFGEPYSGPVLAALGRAGVDVVVTDEMTVRQVGERRRVDGDEPVRLVA